MPKTKTMTQQSTDYPVRGNELVGKVVSAKTPKMVTVEREMVVYLSKYERYKKVKSTVHAHNPESINAKEGDIVTIGETRKISKTKNFIVTQIVGHAKTLATHEEMTEGMRTKTKTAEKEEQPEETA
ncbi:MAG: 30S ribosomal protein S17 [archaeon]